MAITKKKNGKYQVRVYVGYDHITGKRKTKYATCETAREARIKEAQIITDVETGELVADWEAPKVQKHYTFDEAYEEWFDIYKRQGLARSTVVNTKEYFGKYLLQPELFGGMYLERMSRKDIQKRLNDFVPKYVESHKIISYANRVLKWAVNNEDIAFNDNPLEHVTLVKAKTSKKREVKYYTEEQVQAFEKGINTYWGTTRRDLLTIFTLLLRTGARIGEILGLQWQDVDFQNGILVLDGRISASNDGTMDYLDGLKNGDDIRKIEIDSNTLMTLRKWKQEQREELFSLGHKLVDTDFLFSYAFDARKRKTIYYRKGTIREALLKFYEWYNSSHNEKLPYLNLHGFRHTHASLLLSNGVDLKRVSERLGHKDITITANIYADVTPKARREVADKFSEIMGDNA